MLRRAARNMLMLWGGAIVLMGIASIPLAIVHSDWRYLALGAGLLLVGGSGLYWLRRVDIVEDWEEGFAEYERRLDQANE